MTRMTEPRTTAFVEQMVNIPWQEFPGHFGGALSKALVGEQQTGSPRMDFRISHYAPCAYVAEHVHQVQEQIYHILEGEALMELDAERRVVRRHDVVFVPPGVRHAIYNTGLTDLTFIVVTAPPEDAEPA